MSAIKITSENFEAEVLNCDKTVLLDFWASWCGPCKMVSPIIDLSADAHSAIKVGKVNVDEEQALAAEFKVMSIPSIFVVKDGKIVNQAVGAMPKSKILELL